MTNLLSVIRGIARAAPTDKCILELDKEKCNSRLTNIIIPLKLNQNISSYQVPSACDSCLEALERSDKCYLGTMTNLKEKYPIVHLMSKSPEDINDGICLTIEGNQFNIEKTPLQLGVKVLHAIGSIENNYISNLGNIVQKIAACDNETPKPVFTTSEEPVKEFPLACSVHNSEIFELLDKREEELQKSLVVILSKVEEVS